MNLLIIILKKFFYSASNKYASNILNNVIEQSSNDYKYIDFLHYHNKEKLFQRQYLLYLMIYLILLILVDKIFLLFLIISCIIFGSLQIISPHDHD